VQPDHRGRLPLPIEIRSGSPSVPWSAAKRRTYTSSVPVTSDWYASQCPSGESTAPVSSNWELSKGNGSRPLAVGE
jgi:hypothetical protein